MANIIMVSAVWDLCAAKESLRVHSMQVFMKFFAWGSWLMILGFQCALAIETGRYSSGGYDRDNSLKKIAVISNLSRSMTFGLYLALAMAVASFDKHDFQRGVQNHGKAPPLPLLGCGLGAIVFSSFWSLLANLNAYNGTLWGSIGLWLFWIGQVLILIFALMIPSFRPKPMYSHMGRMNGQAVSYMPVQQPFANAY